MGNKEESAMTKLNNEAATVSGYNVPAIAIRDHVAQRIMTDAVYAEKVIAEGKTLSKCYQYISDIAYEIARKMSKADKQGGIMIGMSSDEIFALADEYYTLSDDELKKKLASKSKKLRNEEFEELERTKAKIRNGTLQGHLLVTVLREDLMENTDESEKVSV
ncbi:MAG: hypothetical protein J6L61_05195 [Ruminiclostridium sp.]|nr:hypothetical protein [Ruminiclostridium sp.]